MYEAQRDYGCTFIQEKIDGVREEVAAYQTTSRQSLRRLAREISRGARLPIAQVAARPSYN